MGDNRPVPVAHAELVDVLRDLLARVEAHDSFEGSLTYTMPGPAPDHELKAERVGGLSFCETCGVGHADADDLRQIHAGDPQTTAEGERTDFMLQAAYRVANSMGQGGMRVIGKTG